jgi:hypothetical protein
MEIVGHGATSFVNKTSRSSVLKQPFPGCESEVNFERDVYERLGRHPRIPQYIYKIEARVSNSYTKYINKDLDQSALTTQIL